MDVRGYHTIEEVEKRLAELPKGTLTYKTINGKKQPYLQRNERGHCKSIYIKISERERVLLELEERKQLQDRLELLRRYHQRIADVLTGNPFLANRPGIGYQDFETMINGNMFYVDKTHFIKAWWESDTQVSLITRPRRFGKTLMLSTVNCFFSILYKDRGDLFRRFRIWKEKSYRTLQGTYPTIFITFAAVKDSCFADAIGTLSSYFLQLFEQHRYLVQDGGLDELDKKLFYEYEEGFQKQEEQYCCFAIRTLCQLLYKYYDKKVILLLDEYDTPMQEAYMNGYWNEMAAFMRKLFNLSFKTNTMLERALITGITRITKESMFSDVNNMVVYSVTSAKYADCFGFTEQELIDSLDCHDVAEQSVVKEWYDGFTIGNLTDIYNPWSIINYISERELQPYWANSGGYGLIDRIILQGKNHLKEELVDLLNGGSIHKCIDENITFAELDDNPEAIWSLLLAGGYLKADDVRVCGETECNLSVTNRETMFVFDKMIRGWFRRAKRDCNYFAKALLADDVDGMNAYLNNIAMEVISVFDVGNHPSESAPERFYHGFVLGLLVDLREEYEVSSNRESGYGRYDVLLMPRKNGYDGIILEFKVFDVKKEKSLEDTVANAHRQIKEKGYREKLLNRGVPKEQIRSYGFAFRGKCVLIG